MNIGTNYYYDNEEEYDEAELSSFMATTAAATSVARASNNDNNNNNNKRGRGKSPRKMPRRGPGRPRKGRDYDEDEDDDTAFYAIRPSGPVFESPIIFFGFKEFDFFHKCVSQKLESAVSSLSYRVCDTLVEALRHVRGGEGGATDEEIDDLLGTRRKTGESSHSSSSRNNKRRKLNHPLPAEELSEGKKPIKYNKCFEAKLEELKAYKEEHGHTEVPSGTSLRQWQLKCRRQYAALEQGKPSPLRLEDVVELSKLGFSLKPDNPSSKKINERVMEYVGFVKKQGRFPDPKSQDNDETRLGCAAIKWRHMRRLHLAGITTAHYGSTHFPDELSDALDSVDFRWHSLKDMILELKAYKEKHGTTDPPIGSNLRQWLFTRRREYTALQEGKPSPLKQDTIDALTELGFSLTTGHPPIKKMKGRVEDYIEFVKKHGRFPTCLSEDPAESVLGNSAHKWRKIRKDQLDGATKSSPRHCTCIPQDLVDALGSVNFRWEGKDLDKPKYKKKKPKNPDHTPVKKIEERVAEFVEFVKTHKRFPTKNTEDRDEKVLSNCESRWRTMRRLYNEGVTTDTSYGKTEIAQNLIDALDSVNFRWELRFIPQKKNNVRLEGKDVDKPKPKKKYSKNPDYPPVKRIEERIAEYVEFVKKHKRFPTQNNDDRDEKVLSNCERRWRAMRRLYKEGVTRDPTYGKTEIAQNLIDALDSVNFRWEVKFLPPRRKTSSKKDDN